MSGDRRKVHDPHLEADACPGCQNIELLASWSGKAMVLAGVVAVVILALL